jgi:septum formation protein
VLILASRSPQRRAILETLGVEFEVRPVDVDETDEGLPREAVRANAIAKARAAFEVAQRPLPPGVTDLARHRRGEGEDPETLDGEDVFLGVDTIVALGHDIYGKPRDADHARGTLRALSGVTHSVVSAIAVLAPGAQERVALATTDVTFRRLDEPTIDWYVTGDEWRERAGGYAIQGRGAALVERIDGDYTNVVGLPVVLLLDLLPDLLAG